MIRLSQLLSYLARDEVTEIVVGSGRAITIRSSGTYKQLTTAQVSLGELRELVRSTELEPLLPATDTSGVTREVTLQGNVYSVQLMRRGEAVSLTITRPLRSATTQVIAVDRVSVSPGIVERSAKRRVDPRSDDEDAAAAPPRKSGPTNNIVFSSPRAKSSTAKKRSSSSSAPPDTSTPRRREKSQGIVPSPDVAPPDVVVSSSATARAVSSSAAAPAPAGPVHEPDDRRTVAAAVPVFVPQLLVDSDRSIPDALLALLSQARGRHATDLHLAAEQPASIRVNGQLVQDGAPLDAALITSVLEPLLTGAERHVLAERGYVDFAFTTGEGQRTRANVSRHRGGLKGTFRMIWDGIPTLEALALPSELQRVTSAHQGLVVITGPTGHGKTTTLAALIDRMNRERPHHILSVEDPIEIVHPRKQAVVSQRAVGIHTLSFANALKASLREDPDVIVIGEVRDRETVEIALTAAETGHLVLVTMSTPSAAKTIDRMIDMFPPDDQQQVRVSLAAALRFVISQRLLPRRDGNGVVPAVELLTAVLPVVALIRDNKLFQLPSVQQRGRAFGMIRFDDSLIELARTGVIDPEVAIANAENRRDVQAILHPKGTGSLAQPQAAPAPVEPKSRLGGFFRRSKD